jgi:hypothetical protein
MPRGPVAVVISIGVEAAWTMWTHVVRPDFGGGGGSRFMATDSLTMSAVLLLLTVGWSSAH